MGPTRPQTFKVGPIAETAGTLIFAGILIASAASKYGWRNTLIVAALVFLVPLAFAALIWVAIAVALWLALVWIFSPAAGPVAAVVIVGALYVLYSQRDA